jgi:hypothetical protein
MKPGCFLKSIIILTIIVAAIMYIIQHKSELFFEHGKKIIAGTFLDNWNEQFNYVKDTPEKAELKNSLKTYIDSLKPKDIPDEKDIDNILNMVRSAASDSIISKDELRDISKKLTLLKNERPE